MVREKANAIWNGLDYFRNNRFLNQKSVQLSDFFYISLLSSSSDYVAFSKDTFKEINSQRQGRFQKINDLFIFTYSNNEKKCFRQVNQSLFLYEINCSDR